MKLHLVVHLDRLSHELRPQHFVPVLVPSLEKAISGEKWLVRLTQPAAAAPRLLVQG